MQQEEIKYSKLEISDFAKLFNTTIEEIQLLCGDIVNNYDFSYNEIGGTEKDELLLEIIKKIDSQSLSSSGTNRKPDWEFGWDENLSEFMKHNYDTQYLIPKYFKKNVPLKLFNKFIMPNSNNFEYNYLMIFRSWLFKKYFSNLDSIYEFGCGSAANLVFLSKLFPDKQLFGYDWALASQKIIDLLQKKLNLNINGGNFDFFSPNRDLNFKKNSGVFTFGALEQTGTNYNEFLNFVLEKKPDLIINVECLNDLYNKNNLLDYLALKYHKKRNYLDHYFKRLKALEKDRRIEIIYHTHHKFSNIFNDTHSFIIWKVKNNHI